MSIILEIFLLILWIVVGICGSITGTVIAVIRYGENGEAEGLRRLARFAGIVIGGIFLTSVMIGTPFATGIINLADNSEHCGTGTVYRSEVHGSGKNSRTEWWCERA